MKQVLNVMSIVILMISSVAGADSKKRDVFFYGDGRHFIKVGRMVVEGKNWLKLDACERPALNSTEAQCENILSMSEQQFRDRQSCVVGSVRNYNAAGSNLRLLAAISVPVMALGAVTSEVGVGVPIFIAGVGVAGISLIGAIVVNQAYDIEGLNLSSDIYSNSVISDTTVIANISTFAEFVLHAKKSIQRNWMDCGLEQVPQVSAQITKVGLSPEHIIVLGRMAPGVGTAR